MGTSCDIETKGQSDVKSKKANPSAKARANKRLLCIIRQSYEIEIIVKANKKGRVNKPDQR